MKSKKAKQFQKLLKKVTEKEPSNTNIARKKSIFCPSIHILVAMCSSLNLKKKKSFLTDLQMIK